MIYLFLPLLGCLVLLPSTAMSGDSDPCCGGSSDFTADDINPLKWGNGNSTRFSFGSSTGLKLIFDKGFLHEPEYGHTEGIICRALLQGQDFGSASIWNVGAYEGSVIMRVQEARKLVFIMKSDRKSHGLNFKVHLWGKDANIKPAVECVAADTNSVGCLHWHSY